MASHTEPYKFMLDILANNSSLEILKDLIFGQVLFINILHYRRFLASGIPTMVFYFRFRCRDNEPLTNMYDMSSWMNLTDAREN